MLVLQDISFVLSNGRRLKFRTDIWCGMEPLCVSFPLFCRTISKEAWVVDLLVHLREQYHWNLGFSCPLNDRELEEVLDCLFQFQGWVVGNKRRIQ